MDVTVACRCTRRAECSRGQDPEPWLWSFQPEQGCLRVVAVSPANISREEKREVFLSVPDLPSLRPEESYSCHFGELQSEALLTGSGVMCFSPEPNDAPALPRGADHIVVNVELRLGSVLITQAPLTFYDCAAVTDLRPSAPCQACVSSRWGCNWCVWEHLCTHKTTCDTGPMIVSQQSLLLSPTPPARGPPTLFPPTVLPTIGIPSPDTFLEEPGAPYSTATSDVLPETEPSLLSPWGPWAGPGPPPTSASSVSPLHEEPPPPSTPDRLATADPALHRGHAASGPRRPQL